jgi:hypothetical protein
VQAAAVTCTEMPSLRKAAVSDDFACLEVELGFDCLKGLNTLVGDSGRDNYSRSASHCFVLC